MRLLYDPSRVWRILQNTVGVDDVDAGVAERKRRAVGNEHRASLPVDREVLAREPDGRLREIESDDVRATAGKADKVGPNAASDLEEAAPREPGEIDGLGKVGQLVEPVIIELLEELPRPGRARRHLEIVDARVPVGADVACQIRTLWARHAGYVHQESRSRALT